MKERPILFSGAMVRALLAGTKTQTRRVIKPQPEGYLPEWPPHYDKTAGGAMWGSIRGDHGIACPFGMPGDRLYVRETFAGDDLCGWVYRADHPDADIKAGELDCGEQSLRRWTPAIHMPRRLCRLDLEVTAVRVERLQEISEADAIAEGIERESGGFKSYETILQGPHRGERHPHSVVPNKAATTSYRELWDALNAARGYGWAVNPWVWVVEFKRCPATA